MLVGVYKTSQQNATKRLNLMKDMDELVVLVLDDNYHQTKLATHIVAVSRCQKCYATVTIGCSVTSTTQLVIMSYCRKGEQP